MAWDPTGGWSCDEFTPLLRLASLATAHGWGWCQAGGSQSGVSNRCQAGMCWGGGVPGSQGRQTGEAARQVRSPSR